MTVVGEAFVEIRPKTDEFGHELDKDVEKAVAKTDRKLPLTGELDHERSKSAVLGGIKALGAAVGGAFVVKEVFDFGRDAIAAAEESRKVAAQTEAAIKSTGGAAKVTGDDIAKLSSRISGLTGVDDEAIQSGANLLLTFTNVRNEAGKGNDIFNQATSTLTDMAAALGGDVSANAVQLGKALNDPVAGVSALSRVGVTFTDDQKKVIEAMVKTGDVAGAQKVILAELGKEFGGSAAAQATAGDRLKVTLGNLQEDIGARLLPVFDKVAGWLADKLPAAIDKAGDFIGKITKVAGTLGTILKFQFGDDPDVTSDGWIGVFEKITIHIRAFAEGLGLLPQATGPALDGVRNFGAFIRDTLIPAVVDVASWIQDHWKPVLLGLALAISPIGVVIAGLAFLVIKHFDEIKAVVGPVIDFLVERFGQVRDFAAEIFPQVAEAVGHAMNVVGAVIGAVVAFVGEAWALFGDDILRVTSAVFSQIGAIVEFAMNLVQNVIRLVLAVINGDWGKAWDAIKNIMSGALDLIVSTLKNLGGVLAGLFGAAFDAGRRAVEFAVPKIVEFVSGIPGRILGALGDMAKLLLPFGDGLIDGFVSGIRRSAGKVISAIKDAITDKLPGFVKDALGIRSPSTVFQGLGEQVVAGFAEGLRDVRDVDDALSRMLAIPAGASFGGVAGGGGGGAVGGLGVSGPLVSIVVQGDATDATVERFRQVARDEIVPVLDRVLTRATAGTGTRA